MSFERDVKLVYQSLLDEHSGSERMALWDLCHRFVIAQTGTSWAMLRCMNPATDGRIDDVPNPIDDTWVTTAREG